MPSRLALPSVPLLSIPVVRAVTITALLHGLLAVVTLIFTRNTSSIAAFWPPNAIVVAAIWTLPRRQWAPFLVAGLIANMAANCLFNPPLVGIAFALTNMGEAALAALLLGRTRDSAEALGTMSRVARFFVMAGIVAPMLGALGGASVVHFAFGADFLPAYSSWFAADSLGLLVFAPLALLVRTGEIAPRGEPTRADILKTGAMLLAVAVSAIAVFAQSHFPLLFLVFAPVTFAACKLGRAGATVALVIVAVTGALFTLMGSGPLTLILGGDSERILFFQLFLAVLLLTALPVAAETDERRALIAKLAEREETLLLLMEQSSDLVLHLDLAGNCTFASGSGAMLPAHALDAMCGRNILSLPHPSDVARLEVCLEAAVTQPGRSHRCEYRMADEHGDWTWMEANIRAITCPDGDVTGIVTALRDVSHHKRREADLHLAAKTDALTGIPNRAGFIERLDRMLAQPPEGGLWVGMLDIDHFKAVNDTHGHAAGDEVLRTVAERLRLQLRQGDGIGRVGGEEFAIILSGVDTQDAMHIASRLRQSISRQPVELASGVSLLVTLSGGFVPALAGQSRDAIVAAADGALYQSKRQGWNRTMVLNWLINMGSPLSDAFEYPQTDPPRSGVGFVELKFDPGIDRALGPPHAADAERAPFRKAARLDHSADGGFAHSHLVEDLAETEQPLASGKGFRGLSDHVDSPVSAGWTERRRSRSSISSLRFSCWT